MSMTIFTTCSQCGREHYLVPGEISLEILPSGGEGSYSFNCPLGHKSVRQANRRVVGILLAVGVTYRIDRKPYPPLTEIDIENFIKQLDSNPLVWQADLDRLSN